MQILIVDDKEVNRNLLNQILTKMGYSILEASDGNVAIDAIKNHTIDLVLMDIMMPGMNGFDAAKNIKQLVGEKYLPIIYVTALSENDALETALAAGGDDFICKPVNFAILESKIKAHIRIRNLTEQIQSHNQQLLKHNQHLAREQELVAYFFDNALKQSYLDPRCIKHHVSPISAFNGDILFVTQRPVGGLYVLIGDFTGHGLSAAMGTLPVAQTFFQCTKKSLSIAEIAREINHHLYTLLPIDMFLAATLVEIPAAGENISIWSGGMPDAYIVNNKKEKIKSVRAQHMPLGVLNKEEFDMSVQLYRLSAGDKLYFSTDGIIESTNDGGEMFGETRLSELFQNYDNDAFEQVLDTFRNFCDGNQQEDDITFIEINCDNIPTNNVPQKQASKKNKFNAMPLQIRLPLSAEQMRNMNPVNQLVDMLSQVPELNAHRDIIHTLLSEMYNNALEHGVLGLKSMDKSDDESFIEYYAQRERALEQLYEGSILVEIDYLPEIDNGTLKMRIHDSGNGFNYQNSASSVDAPFGRGLLLVSSLCENMNIADNGSTVEAIYRV